MYPAGWSPFQRPSDVEGGARTDVLDGEQPLPRAISIATLAVLPAPRTIRCRHHQRLRFAVHPFELQLDLCSNLRPLEASRPTKSVREPGQRKRSGGDK
jgi:hypothetical protein